MSSGARITIRTKGVRGAPRLLDEFIMNVPKVLGSKPLEEYTGNVTSDMQFDAPVDTGFLRSMIRNYRVDPYTMAVTAWAPYSGWAEYRSKRPYYFSKNTYPSKGNGAMLMGDASIKYLRTLINKYQNQP